MSNPPLFVIVGPILYRSMLTINIAIIFLIIKQKKNKKTSGSRENMWLFSPSKNFKEKASCYLQNVKYYPKSLQYILIS